MWVELFHALFECAMEVGGDDGGEESAQEASFVALRAAFSSMQKDEGCWVGGWFLIHMRIV